MSGHGETILITIGLAVLGAAILSKSWPEAPQHARRLANAAIGGALSGTALAGMGWLFGEALGASAPPGLNHLAYPLALCIVGAIAASTAFLGTAPVGVRIIYGALGTSGAVVGVALTWNVLSRISSGVDPQPVVDIAFQVVTVLVIAAAAGMLATSSRELSPQLRGWRSSPR